MAAVVTSVPAPRAVSPRHALRLPVQIVWFKRDLRVVTTTRPAGRGRGLGPVPAAVTWSSPAFGASPMPAAASSPSCASSLAELRRALAALGQPLVVRVGEAVEVGAGGSPPAAAVRCAVVARGDRQRLDLRPRPPGGRLGAARTVFPGTSGRQTGVIRRLASRDGWARRWDRPMRQPLRAGAVAPAAGAGDRRPVMSRPSCALDRSCPGASPAARSGRRGDCCAASSTERGRPYRRPCRAPRRGRSLLAPVAASAWGTLSMREALQAAEARLRALDAGGGPRPGRRARPRSSAGCAGTATSCRSWRASRGSSIAAFHPAYEGLRGADAARLAAWAEGRTGWPFVDACMRMLAHRLAQLPHAGDADERRLVPALAGLAGDRPASRAPVHRLRAGHPLAASADAIRRQRDQHDPDLQSGQAGPRPGSRRRLRPTLVSGACPRSGRALHMPWPMSPLEQATRAAGSAGTIPRRSWITCRPRDPRATGYGQCAAARTTGPSPTRSRLGTAAAAAVFRNRGPGGQSQAVSLHCSSNR